MIAQLLGCLLRKSPTQALLDVNGVGYELSISLSTFERLGQVGQNTTLLTYLHVREDILQLFGFATDAERQLFKLLIAVNGVGPKVAQGILSGCTVEMFCQYIQNKEILHLTSIPGIGKKTAERLIIELRDRVARLTSADTETSPEGTVIGDSEEALMALVSLGYQRIAAEKAIQRVNAESGEFALEELIKNALRYI